MSPIRNPRYQQAKVVFDIAAGGSFDLPPALPPFLDAVGRLRLALAAAGKAAEDANPGGVRARLGVSLASLAKEGDLPKGWVDELIVAQAEQVRAGTQQMVVDDALGRAESALVKAVIDYSSVIVEDSLRPVLDDIVAKVRAAVDGATEPLPFDSPGKLARASRAVRDAYAEVEQQQVRYSDIRRCQSQLQMLTGDADPDAYGAFHELRNMTAIWPTRVWQVAGNTPPWPKDPLARLVWVCTEPREVWMPTGYEIEEAQAAYLQGRALLPRQEGIQAMPVAPSGDAANI
jgi:hypothetical protein